jgi:hypothetical protein
MMIQRGLFHLLLQQPADLTRAHSLLRLPSVKVSFPVVDFHIQSVERKIRDLPSTLSQWGREALKR